MGYHSLQGFKFYSNDFQEEVTLGFYLGELLRTLIIEEEGFSAKRPLGNSGWTSDIYNAMAREGLVDSTVEYDEVVADNYKDPEALVLEVIDAAFSQ